MNPGEVFVINFEEFLNCTSQFSDAGANIKKLSCLHSFPVIANLNVLLSLYE